MRRLYSRCVPRVAQILLALAVLLGLAAPVRAQQAGSLAGVILDPLGARVSGAAIQLLNEDGQTKADTKSGLQGEFTFDNLAEGRYQIQAAADGFQVRTTEQMFLASGTHALVDVSLPLGPLEADVSVTAAANEVLPSQVGAPVTVLDAITLGAIGKVDLLEALRLVPGSSLVQTGGRGGATSIFIRGGNSNFTKVLFDGVPANDIGGAIDLSAFSMAGVDRIDVLREANSVVLGTDALAGVIDVTTPRGHTRIPEASFSLDGGTLSTDHEAASIGGVAKRVDYFSEFSHFGTDNKVPNNADRMKTYAGRFGLAVGNSTDVTATVRWTDKYAGLPNGISLFGVPDDAFQTSRMHLFGFSGQTLLTSKWQAAVRVGVSDQRSDDENPTLSGQNIFGTGFGNTVTIAGANGYSATGQAALDFGPYSFQSRSARQGVYAQTTYQVNPALGISAGGDYEREQAFTDPDADPTTTRHNSTAWVESRGAIADRVTATAGVGYAAIQGYASRFAPRVSVAAYLRQPAPGEFWGDARVTFNAGKGIKASSVSAVNQSLFALLQNVPGGAALAANDGIGPIAPERGRNVDVGIEQGMWRGRLRARAAYFNNEFFDLIEFVSKNLLPQFGVTSDVAAATGTGAYVNSQSYKAQGIETSVDAKFGHIRVAGSYTYLDAVVTKSLSSSVTPQFNPLFPGIAIGGFTALVGQRPFRRPANTGTLLVAYSQGRVDAAVTSYFAGKSDDSTFLVGSDINYGNTLLLPNHNLDAAYQKVDLSGGYRILPRMKAYAAIENLTNKQFEAVFGFPGLPITARAGLTIDVGGR